MSQTIADVSPVPATEFGYKPVPALAPATLVLGLCSAISLLSTVGLGLSFFGMIFGAVCLLKIRRSGGELGGKTLAATGLALSLVFLISGATYHSYVYATEVPEGYQRVSFTLDIARKEFLVDDNGLAQVDPDIQKLDGRKIFLKGYMYPTRQSKGLGQFILCKDNGQCCFGGQPKLSDMILVNMQDGQSVDFYPNLVAVSGEFRVRPKRGFHFASAMQNLHPIYELDVTHFGRAKTQF